MSKRKFVYVAYGYDHYEMPCEPMLAFSDETEANAYVERCRAYHETRPESLPEGASDAAIDAYFKRSERWEKRHPAKGQSHRDGFAVMKLTLDLEAK